MKVYMIAEAQHIAQGSACDSFDIFPFAVAYPTIRAARSAVRETIREIVAASYEGCPDSPDIESTLDEILSQDSAKYDIWHWDADDRSVTWRIVEASLKTKPKKGAHK